MEKLNEHIRNLRTNYSLFELVEHKVHEDPIIQFSIWLQEALDAKINEPHAMTLATANNGVPSARIVLLKEIANGQFVFYSNYESRKGNELHLNPRCHLSFYWPELQRQVLVNGHASKVDTQTSALYFHSRPRESQIGAWASKQSKVIPTRELLQSTFNTIEQEFSGKQIPLPKVWGGYQVEPNSIEFWQGRPNRLHDRLLYSKNETNWKIERLSP